MGGPGREGQYSLWMGQPRTSDRSGFEGGLPLRVVFRKVLKADGLALDFATKEGLGLRPFLVTSGTEAGVEEACGGDGDPVGGDRAEGEIPAQEQFSG